MFPVLSLLALACGAAHQVDAARRGPISIPLRYRSSPDPRDRSLAQRDTTSLWLKGDYKTDLTAQVTIGTPPQTLSLVVDTGSTDLWVKSSNCTLIGSNPNSCTLGNLTFDSAASSSFETFDTKFHTGIYNEGNFASGLLAKDNVTIAGHSFPNQTLGFATELYDPLMFGAGGLGLSYERGANASSSWLRALFESEDFDEKVIGLYFGKMGAGELLFGGTNATLRSTEVDYYDVIDEDFWTVKLFRLYARDRVFELNSDQTSATIDTSSSYIGGPQEVLDRIFSEVEGVERIKEEPFAGYYTAPCNSPLFNTSFMFNFGNAMYTLSPAELNAGVIGGLPKCLFPFKAIDVSPQPSPFRSNSAWILGQPFLKSVYTVLRIDPPAVGFAYRSDVEIDALPTEGRNDGSGDQSSASSISLSMGAAAATLLAVLALNL